MPKTLYRKIRNLEDAITRDMNPSLERALRSGTPEAKEDALRKVNAVILLAKRVRWHVLRRIPSPPLAVS